jgi:DnaJ like chaperone protein
LTIQQAFFKATFQVMGHLAKADGRVTEQGIRAARSMMEELSLREDEMQAAMDLYREGKDRDFPLQATLTDLARLCADRADLCRMFVLIQLQTAFAGDGLNAAGRSVLARIAAALRVSAYEVIQMEALLRMQRAAPRQKPTVDRLAEAHEVLGVERTATDAEITKAYRRLMNRHHPDKLVAKGLPASMMRLAEEKTRQIRAAYEVIREQRAMK